MSLREEIKQFMVASEALLDGRIKEEELTNLEVGLIQHYLLEVDKKFPARPSD